MRIKSHAPHLCHRTICSLVQFPSQKMEKKRMRLLAVPIFLFRKWI
ncbi:hypothetical protein TRIP_C21406 [Candidatus Zixiibacteriota bacterium]|nr:hypothetical protein TRIP_C21406 [candidate division Zixibacteria bacterium]